MSDPAEAITRLPSWPDSRLVLSRAAQWLIDHDGKVMPVSDLLDGFCRQLLEEGVPLFRVTTGLPSMHPLTLTRAFIWQRDQGVTMAERGHEVMQSDEYLKSPIAVIHEGAAAIRRQIELPETPMDFGILPELKDAGVTDYLVLPMRFTQGPGMGSQGVGRTSGQNVSFMSFATDRKGGFRPDELNYLMELMPLIALRMELEASRRMSRDLLTTYLGQSPAERVLNGDIRRGRGYEVEAAIWLSDLRGFTRFSDRNETVEVVATLDRYFDAMAGPIQAHGGEVLKFIGDGVLAIFRVEEGNTLEAACRRALTAAENAFADLHELNQGRAIAGVAPLKVGLGLHVGKVVYGNIGSRDRLDFTVIGRAVNEVARLEAQTKAVDKPLLASAAFAEAINGDTAAPYRLDSIGFHALRGVREPQELFTLPTERLAGYE
ncbi:adenylate/guanylate cyclase domain-containing protein [Ferrovibrio sp.]|uniref:adenylate/guanylate cyclase domain-containing protein n=1 Tax=Ferrovibrio sp. TaxID=1917215 RepID=UPI000CBF40C2|nr:adenylate/guanylate cyclase domain-containing protein [Ferrovibrio sp.]PJI43868.1 MAG: adenylate/guanylate cyclase domain-containing protein [Ferrovibrio sp.]